MIQEAKMFGARSISAALFLTTALCASELRAGDSPPDVPGRGGPPIMLACPAKGLVLKRFPIGGRQGEDWMISNHVDLEAREGRCMERDFENWTDCTMPQARTYDGHRGTDISLPSLRVMDNGSAVVHAALEGTVTRVVQSHPDRNTATFEGCNDVLNIIKIEHAGGFTTSYLHIKRNSALVKVGDRVSAGQRLAVAGSSGCSTAAHLHFEVRDCNNRVLEPFAQVGAATRSGTNWQDLPAVYSFPIPAIMDVMLRRGAFGADGTSATAQIKDPLPNITALNQGSVLGIGLSAASYAGSRFDVKLLRPDGTTHWSRTYTDSTQRYRHIYLHWRVDVGMERTGTWTVEVSVPGPLGGVQVERRSFLLTPVIRTP